MKTEIVLGEMSTAGIRVVTTDNPCCKGARIVAETPCALRQLFFSYRIETMYELIRYLFELCLVS
ncbi:hypothetical protein Pyrfu_0449 [Pyrolobus fumarii 1A]|uniref:Uncharacterized protein n=1 Tax=Pyrolobus fumarii (strain DSM 11204 / 1A) TaxID=694429 RepID=G0EG72_PYRF1|nr:hypothetical protein Pyrfu_0449 [Pyrolobus fumarii 1A]